MNNGPPLNLFDWNVIGQLAVMCIMLTVLLMVLFVLKEAGAQAAHRRNLERMDKERYGRRKGDGPATEKDEAAGMDRRSTPRLGGSPDEAHAGEIQEGRG
jgi:hypothetical protein